MDPLRSLEKLNRLLTENESLQKDALSEMEKLAHDKLNSELAAASHREVLIKLNKTNLEHIRELTTEFATPKTFVFTTPVLLKAFIECSVKGVREVIGQEVTSLRFKINTNDTISLNARQRIDELKLRVTRLQKKHEKLSREKPELVRLAKETYEKVRGRYASQTTQTGSQENSAVNEDAATRTEAGDSRPQVINSTPS
jgi:hypothetical protein